MHKKFWDFFQGKIIAPARVVVFKLLQVLRLKIVFAIIWNKGKVECFRKSVARMKQF